MKIGVDLDDILLDFTQGLFDWHNKNYGTSFKKSDRNHYIFDKLFDCTLDEAKKRTFDYDFSVDNTKSLPIPGAQVALKKLKKDHEIYIITGRQEEVKDAIIAWLNIHYADLFDGIYFTNFFHGSKKMIQKSEVCKKIGIDVFIDDVVLNAEDVFGTGAKVFLFDAPWNQEKISDGIIRVSSWTEILEKI